MTTSERWVQMCHARDLGVVNPDGTTVALVIGLEIEIYPDNFPFDEGDEIKVLFAGRKGWVTTDGEQLF